MGKIKPFLELNQGRQVFEVLVSASKWKCIMYTAKTGLAYIVFLSCF